MNEQPTLESVKVGDTVIIEESSGYWGEAKVVHVTAKYFICGRTRYRKADGRESTTYHSKNQAYHPDAVIEWRGGKTAKEVCNEYQERRKIELKQTNLRRFIEHNLRKATPEQLEAAAMALGWEEAI